MLALGVHVRDEADDLRELLISARPFVDKIVVVADVASTDGTVAVARELADLVHEISFPAGGFAELANLCVSLCAGHAWSLRLDCDERLTGWRELRDFAARTPPTAAWQIPRRRWADRGMQTQVDAHDPDWQVRLVPVGAQGRFTRLVHVDFEGMPVKRLDEVGLSRAVCIEHFHDATGAATRARRRAQDLTLAAAAGIAAAGGQRLDARCSRCGAARASHTGAFEYAVPPFTASGCGGFVA